ncbi:MAG: MerR family transcriptional regulator [Bacillota bacterium]
MYTIGQLSRICQVTTKALRHYEEIGLLKPARVDKFNQYRYYSDEQVDLVRLIRIARDTGMPLERIRDLLQVLSRGDPPGPILEAHRADLLAQMNDLDGRLARLSWWQRMITNARMEDMRMEESGSYEVVVREVPAMPVRSIRRTVSGFPQSIVDMMGEVAGEIVSAGGVPAGPPTVLYYDEEFNPDKVDVEVAFPVSDSAMATRTIPATLAVTTVHVGPYDGLAKAYMAVYGWANDNGYEAVVPMRDVYMNDPANTPLERLVTEVIVPVKKKA